MKKTKSELSGTTEQDCVICGIRFTGWGHNPEPVKKYEEGRACSDCNAMKVIPARLRECRESWASEGEHHEV